MWKPMKGLDRRETEWKLDTVVFKAVQAKLGVCDNVDLFATRLNNQASNLIQVHGR